MSKRNPWDHGLMIAAGLLVVLGALFIIGVLVTVALGVQLSENPTPGSRWIALGMLALIAGLVFVAGMSARWKRRNALTKQSG